MVLNGVELEFDFYDADQMEILENALEEFGKKMESADRGVKQSVMIRNMCQATIDLLDEVFGEGTSNDVFGEETNFKKSMQVFKELTNERLRQIEEVNKELEDMSNINVTRMNREQRRTVSKRKN
ncbi:MAG: DUF6673 family protein [Peptostreptococcaceae bacterium]